MSSTSPPLVGERIVLRAFVDNFYVEFFLPEEEVKLFEFFAFTDLMNTFFLLEDVFDLNFGFEKINQPAYLTNIMKYKNNIKN